MKNTVRKIKEKYGIITLIMAVLLIAFYISTIFFSVSKVQGKSMEPTHTNAHFVFELKKDFTGFERFDIISLYDEEKDKHYIKRIVGLPGDHVVVDDCTIYINGEKLDEPYMAEVWETQSVAVYKYTDVVLGEDEYFVCGDNRRTSYDSRGFGPVKLENIDSKVLFAI